MVVNSTTAKVNQAVSVSKHNGVWRGQFFAMASDCEVLLECENEQQARRLLELAANEAWRIEAKYSRYDDNSVVGQINQHKTITLDQETQRLLDFAYQCFELSQGQFDITSGVLQQAWRFDGSVPFPTKAEIEQILTHIGLNKIQRSTQQISLPKGMQLDFGGFGKEYAADRVLQLITEQLSIPCLVNLGGDLATNQPPSFQQSWQVGIELTEQSQPVMVKLKQGGLATSGNTKRYILHDGKRYGHILDPTTGWPVESPPLSVTVAAANCTQAGLLSTLAMLQGKDAEAFLKQQGCQYWLQW